MLNAIQVADLRQWRGSADDANFQRLLRGIKFVQTGKAVPPSQQPEPPKKFPWLPTLFISAAVLGGTGIYWQSTKPSPSSPVGASPAGDSSFAPQINPVEESPARQAPTAVTPSSVVVEQPKRLAFEPKMVSIPAGTFTMGCDAKRDDVEGGCSDDEKPAHQVTLNAFKMGKYEATFDEWDACEKAKVCPHAEDQGWGRGNRPVINVSWDDIT